ncbi:MAG: hypothetical protein ABIK09_01140 [Pseudomonadota bacterium]
MRRSLVPMLLLAVVVGACGPSLKGLGPTASRNTALLRQGPPTLDGVQAYRLQPEGNREELVARLGDLQAQGLAAAILRALPKEAQDDYAEFKDTYAVDPLTQGGIVYLWENNRPDGKAKETAETIPTRVVVTSSGEILRRFLAAVAARKDASALIQPRTDVDLIWLAPLDGAARSLLAEIETRAPEGTTTRVQPSRGIHLLVFSKDERSVVLYAWPGGLIVSIRRTAEASPMDVGVRGLVGIIEAMRRTAGAAPPEGEPGALLPDLRVVIDRHKGGMVLDLRVDKTVLLTATLPSAMLGGPDAAESFRAKWADLKAQAAKTPEALQSELPVPAEYMDLLALLLVNSAFQLQSQNIRITTEVELDLLLTTLLKVQGK